MNNDFQISVAILSHNAESHIRGCLDAVMNQTRPPEEILVVDNNSDDKTLEIIRQHYQSVRVHHSNVNTGCAGGRNLQLAQAAYPFVLIVDDDAILADQCLEELEKAMHQYPEAAIWAPRICYEQNRSVIQFDGGGTFHFICEAILKNPNLDLNELASQDADKAPAQRQCETPTGDSTHTACLTDSIGFQGGVAFLMRKQVALDMGGYDESFFFGRTDGEFSFRLMMEGHDIRLVPSSLVYHKVKPRGFSEVERQIRNRWSMLLQTYSTSTIVVILPALLAYEFALIVFLTLKGQIGHYAKAMRKVYLDRRTIFERRREFLPRKQRRDCDVLATGRINMRADIASSIWVRYGVAAVGAALSIYWSVARRILTYVQ